MSFNDRTPFFVYILTLIIFSRNYSAYLRLPFTYTPNCPIHFPRNFEVLGNISMEDARREFISGICLSNGNGNGNGDKSDDSSKEETKEETKKEEEKPEEKVEEKPPDDQSKQEERPMEESRPEEHHRSRIPTYDEFARFRDSSRPPDSHYPPGPGLGYRRGRSCIPKVDLFIVMSKLDITGFNRYPMRLKTVEGQYLGMMDCHEKFVFLLTKKPAQDTDEKLKKIMDHYWPEEN